MTTVRTVPSYQGEEHYVVDYRHHIIRCANNRGHWYYYDAHVLWHPPAQRMTMDDFGNLIAIN